jgi:F0F1-type ATP synthase assembly protein I
MPFNAPIPDKRLKPKASAGLSAVIQAETAMQIALVLPCAVGIGWALGAWADRLFHQSWIAIAGIILGSVSGLSYVIRVAVNAMSGRGPLGGGDDGGKGDAGGQG